MLIAKYVICALYAFDYVVHVHLPKKLWFQHEINLSNTIHYLSCNHSSYKRVMVGVSVKNDKFLHGKCLQQSGYGYLCEGKINLNKSWTVAIIPDNFMPCENCGNRDKK